MAADSSEPELIDGQWIASAWAGRDKLTCAICQWDTLRGLSAAEERKKNCPRCGPAPEGRVQTAVLVADKYGHPIEKSQEDLR